MRILHTSDWHLGQSFFSKNRKHEHQAFIQWLLEQVDKHSIDAVIIAGDVFDTGTPPSYAREMYNQFVVALQSHQCALVVLGGNHDSVSMLNESREVLACLNTHVIASAEEDPAQQLLVLNDRSGEPGAVLCAIPFLRARDLVTSEAGESGSDKQKALTDAIKSHYASLYQLALEKREALGKPELPVIATGHLTALGVKSSESVRDIYIGTLDGFAADGFPPADYIALGHIHRPQRVAKSEHIRYSGSPIPLSFDELSSQKQVVMVSFASEPEITTLDVPTFQPMVLIKSELESLAEKIRQEQQKHDEQNLWLAVEIESHDYLPDLQQRVAALTEELDVEILQLKRARKKASRSLEQLQNESLSELSPAEVFEKRLEQESFESEEESARRERIRARFTAVVNEVKEVSE